jgi:hypothetical protein
MSGLQARFGSERSPSSAQQFYCREEDVELSNFIQSSIDECCESYISGSPGTGKSSACWDAFIRDSRPAIWMHLDRSGQISHAVWKQAENRLVKYATLPRFANENVGAIQALEASSCRFIVVDGVNSTDQASKVVGLVKSWRRGLRRGLGPPSVAVLFVKSGKVRQEKSEEIMAQNNLIRYRTVSSWDLETFQAALLNQDGSFSALAQTELFPEKRDAEGKLCPAASVSSKFYYAGGCARWMFAYSIEQIVEDARRYLAEADDFSKLLNFQCGHKSSSAKNHVYATFMVNRSKIHS